MRLKDLPLEMQQKYAGQIDVDGMIRVQYYPEDLAILLGIDDTKIADMNIAILNDVQVLQVTAVPINKKTEFKTIRVAPKEQKQASSRRKQTGLVGHGSGPRAPNVDNDKPIGIAEKLAQAGKKFMSNKNKPPWME